MRSFFDEPGLDKHGKTSPELSKRNSSVCLAQCTVGLHYNMTKHAIKYKSTIPESHYIDPDIQTDTLS